jgi:hypothetical protein
MTCNEVTNLVIKIESEVGVVEGGLRDVPLLSEGLETPTLAIVWGRCLNDGVGVGAVVVGRVVDAASSQHEMPYSPSQPQQAPFLTKGHALSQWPQ